MAGLGLDRAYQRSAVDAEFQKLQLQAWSLMADAEIEAQKLVMPEQLQEPDFNVPESNLFGFVVDATNQSRWQSRSVELSAVDLVYITGQLSAVHSGESDRRRLPGGEFILRQGVTYVSEEFQQHTLTFIVVGLGAEYHTQLAIYRQSLYFWMGLILSSLLVLQFLALRWGLKPMSNLADELLELETGKRDALSGNYPKELLGVTNNLNQLLESKNAQQLRYRNTLADLAHSLKTPLAVIQSRLEQSNHPEQKVLLGQVELMDGIVARQLKRAVIHNSSHNENKNRGGGRDTIGVSAPLGNDLIGVDSILQRLCGALTTVYKDKAVELDFSLEPAHCLIDEADLMEMLGGLLDNAFKYCRAQVALSTRLCANKVSIIIEDDGPGIPETQYEAVKTRGVRLDAASAGQGIGLAVSLDLIDAYGGELVMAKSNLGGAKLSVSLPSIPA